VSHLLLPVPAGEAGHERAAEYMVMPASGLQFTRQLPFDTWLGIGRRLASVADSSAWCLGDWLIYGEKAYPGRYRDAIEQTSLRYQTLRNYAWVARQMPPGRRRESLSFGHHAEVAALPELEQEYWLRTAEKLGWSRNRIRQEIRASLTERKGGDQAKPEIESPASFSATDVAAAPAECLGAIRSQELTFVVMATTEQFELFRKVAAQDGRSIGEWAIEALSRAAEETLPLELSRRRDS
jgi:hypothetical protein